MAEKFIHLIYKGYAAREAGKPVEAFELFSKALESSPESPIAAYEVGCFYEEGELVPQDMARAFELFSLAADGCVEAAQKKLAEYYEKGIFVEKNPDLAAHWANRGKVLLAENRSAVYSPQASLEQVLRETLEKLKNNQGLDD
ncbi:MAG: sel1 repeat family protein [Candidatus Melainabacteria bacterium]|nr:sel1 repeat family protein [Candidatus Melainabacteria bacterium]